MAYSPKNMSINPLLSHNSHSIMPEQDAQQGRLPIKVEQNSPMFMVSSNSSNQPLHHPLQSANQNLMHSNHSNGTHNNIGHQPQQTFATSYSNLTAWTTKFTNHGSSSFPPPTSEALTAPMMAGRQLCLPVAAGPIQFSSRTHKASPYHNAFSRMSPLQPKPANQTRTLHSSQPNSIAAVVPMNSSSDMVLTPVPSKENRFKRTAEALHKSGLWEIAMKTGNLMKRNQELQKDLEQFKMDALNFLKSVIKNPENRDFIKTVLNNALSAGATERKKSSVMTVVVSAAAAAAAAAIKYDSSSVSDSTVSTNSQESSMDHSLGVGDKSVGNVPSGDVNCSVNTELAHHM